MLEDEFLDFILCPEFDAEGQFLSYNGRKKFYSKNCKTFNEVLPKMVLDMLVLALNTLKMLNNHYSTACYSNEEDNGKYDDVAKQWWETGINVLKAMNMTDDV